MVLPEFIISNEQGSRASVGVSLALRKRHPLSRNIKSQRTFRFPIVLPCAPESSMRMSAETPLMNMGRRGVGREVVAYERDNE